MRYLPRLLPDFLGQYRAPDGYRAQAWLVLLMTLLLLVIWPIPNGQLPFHRNFVLIPLFLLQAWLVFRGHALPLHWRAFRRPLLLVGVLTGWIVLTGLWHSPSTSVFLQQLNGKWLRALETGFMGLTLLPVLAVNRIEAKRGMQCLWLILLAMTLLALVQLADFVSLWHQSGLLPLGFTRLAYSRFELSVYFNMALVFVFAEIAVRLAMGRSLFHGSRIGLCCVLLILLVSQLGLVTRNATVGIVANLLSITILVSLMRGSQWGRRKTTLFILLAVAVIAGIGVTSWKTDPRWTIFKQTLPLALDTTHHLAWLDKAHHAYPVMANGHMVDVSAYERIAWQKIGYQMVLKEPLGMGWYAENFHRAVEKYYGYTTTTQSHSGMINFTLSNGIPGFILWLMLLGWLIGYGLRHFYQRKMISGLALAIFVMGMTMRGFFDDIWRDHMLEMFFFISGFLLMLCDYEQSSAKIAQVNENPGHE
ncbi:hypothetical protein THUN1379_26350 [Paludibacterium sp. THUN1379]|uniref:O-antigen ligase family protein n=1 Tax=Paludibacterium sp. THUN1379 TaxID=3112107 RepID=UPI00308C9B51|nr:hypothetical protein THUN1379_26350 [Paludibacterium sp. THUN1379]